MHRRNSKLGLLCLAVTMFTFFGYTFSAYQMYFSPSSANVHMNCATQSISVKLSGATYNGYTSYVPYVAGVTYSAHSVSTVPFGPKNFIVGTCNQIGNCDTFYGGGNNGYFAGIQNGGTMTVQNSGYIRTATVSFTGIDPQANSKINSGAAEYTYTNTQLTFSDLTLSFYPGPCATDSIAPTFGFTGGMIPHVTNYTGPQFNDRIYLFDVRDSGSIDRGFTSGFTNNWDVDWTGGTYYAQSVLNGSGIDLSTFTLQVGVETTSESNTFSTITLTGLSNAIGGSAIVGSVAGLVFSPYDYTWNRLNRNYTGSLTTGDLWPSSSLDIDGNRSFGTEREVIMTGYIRDRANNISNTFTRHFNYGANPWSSNKQVSGLVTSCGPNGLSTIGVNTAPTSDSGAYIQKYNSGFYLRPFKVFLHDDWAGIDSGTIAIRISGTQGGAATTIILTGNIAPSTNLNLNGFSRVGPISVATAGNGTQSVYSVPSSTRNYEVTVNYTGKWDSETSINVTVDYKDLVGRAGNQVACNYVSTVAPYSNSRGTTVHLLRTPFPMGGVISGFVIDLQDEWAGVNSGTIVLTISGYEFTGGAVVPRILVFTGAADLDTWLAQYSTGPAGLDILDSQIYNYTITVPNSTDYFSGYFAPEYPVLVSVAYSDLRLPTPNTNASNQGININENPMLRGFSAIAPINRGVAFPLSTYSATSGNTQFSGLEFSIMDHRAGVSGDYNLVVITGSRRGSPAKYVFATPTSTITEPCIDNCVAGTMSSEAAIVSDYDAYTGQHPTVLQSTGFKFQITGHNMYFDYGVYGTDRSYDVSVYLSDLKPDMPNTFVQSQSLSLPSLACVLLERCSHDQLTFVWGSGVSDMNQTIDLNPLTGTLDGNVVDIFGGSRVSVVGSGITVDTGTSILYCNAAGGALDTPITIDFAGITQLSPTPSSTGYSDITLKVADGLFELTGVSNDVLIIQ